ncbi:MAG: TrbL/VirB6 family protein [Ferrimicrobium acidiphilum]
MLRRIFYLILALCISAAPILVFSTPAFAAPVNPTSQGGSSGGGFICSTGTTNSNISNNYLPINRWGGVSSSEFTYLPGGPIGTIVNLPHQSNRMIVGLILSAGNSMWSATSSLTSIAEQFCFGSQAAVQANYVTAALWKFISQGYILSILIVVGVILLVWRARKGTKIGKEVIRIILIAAVIMTLGITSSHTTQADVTSGNYPKYSPAWIVSTVYSALSAVVSVPLSGIDSTIANTVQLGKNQSSAKGYGTGCAAYTDALLTKYKQSYGPNVATQSEAVVPGVVNGIWDNSGLQATAIAQFGDNNYTSSAYCHLYEQEAGISPTAQIAIARSAGKIPPNPSTQSLAFLPEGASQQEQVASMVGWAACTSPNSTALQPQPGWSGVQYTPSILQGGIGGGLGQIVTNALSSLQNGPNTITASDCQKWWSAPASSWNYQGTALYWGTSTSTISSATANAPQAANFLFNFFGDSSTGAFIVAIVYAISSLAVLVTFGLLALAVIVAKFGLLLLMALFIIFLVVDLVPGKSGGHHATKFLKQGVSFLCLAIGVEAILGLVAVMTSIITRFGIGVAGNGIMGMLWVAISPVAAIWSVHHILKTFRIPSPFRPDAAMGWAAAAGAGGFLTGAMADRLTGGYQKLRAGGVRGLRSGAHRAGGALSPKPDKRLYGPRGSGEQMPSKNFDGNAGWQSKTNGSGQKATTSASSGSTANKAKSTSSGPTASSTASTTSGSTAGASTRGHKWAGHQRPAASRSAGTAAVATAALDKVKSQNQASAKPQRWSLNRPAAKPRDINGVPYRSPSQMRLEGAQKVANDRKAMRSATREAKKFVRQQAGPLPQRLASATGERAQLAWARAKANPGKTIARAAGYGAAAMILPVGAPVAAGLALHYGTKKVRTAMAERPAKKAEKKAQLSYVSRNILRDKSKRKLSVGSVATATNGKNATQKYRARTKATSTP